jgi:hypothetical protein
MPSKRFVIAFFENANHVGQSLSVNELLSVSPPAMLSSGCAAGCPDGGDAREIGWGSHLLLEMLLCEKRKL